MTTNVSHIVELRDVYDGWSYAVRTDGVLVNRWALDDDPSQPRPGYERRFCATEEAIGDSERGRLSSLVWP